MSLNKSNNSSAFPTDSIGNAEMALRLFYSTLNKLIVKGVDGKGRLKINLPHTVSMERRIHLLHMLRISRTTAYKHLGSNPPPRSPSSIKSKGSFLSIAKISLLTTLSVNYQPYLMSTFSNLIFQEKENRKPPLPLTLKNLVSKAMPPAPPPPPTLLTKKKIKTKKKLSWGKNAADVR